MMTKKWNLLSFLTKSGVLDEDVLKNDIQMLTAYYIDHGYLDVKISEPKIDFSRPQTDPDRPRRRGGSSVPDWKHRLQRRRPHDQGEPLSDHQRQEKRRLQQYGDPEGYRRSHGIVCQSRLCLCGDIT